MAGLRAAWVIGLASGFTAAVCTGLGLHGSAIA